MSINLRQILTLTLIAVSLSAPYFTRESYESEAANATFETVSYDQNRFKDWSEEQLKQFFNLKMTPYSTRFLSKEFEPTGLNLPPTFDSRQQWPECVLPIRNQGHCGSCWAFAATGSMANRECVATQGSFNEWLSPQDLVNCDYSDFGCNGGNLFTSHMFLKYRGVLTDACRPYHSGDGTQGSCDFWKSECDDKNISYVKHKTNNWNTMMSQEAIKEAIATEGPIVTGFMVYDDFIKYKGGVYRQTSSNLLGGHAVKIVGWGEDHWICENSWDKTWGEDGYFRIAFGESNIDSLTVAGTFN